MKFNRDRGYNALSAGSFSSAFRGLVFRTSVRLSEFRRDLMVLYDPAASRMREPDELDCNKPVGHTGAGAALAVASEEDPQREAEAAAVASA